MPSLNNRRGEYQVKLLPSERIIESQEAPEAPRLSNHSTIDALYRLTKVTAPEKIGDNGLALASLAITKGPGQGLYDVPFGRDSLAIARFSMEEFPKLMRATLIKLAELQGTKDNLYSREEPGKIIHEGRMPDDPIAKELTSRLNWQWPYYGSVDSTPTFVDSFARYLQSGHDNNFLNYEIVGKDGTERTMSEVFQNAVLWIRTNIDRSPSGFIEYKSAFDGDTENHVWMDSPDSYHHHDGAMANHHEGIAALEVQTTTYDALHHAAKIYRTILGKNNEAVLLEQYADKLYDDIQDKFWVGSDTTGYYAPGLDYDQRGNLRQMRIRKSNMGRALDSDLLLSSEADITNRRRSLVKHLTSRAMFGASGIMTLASDELRFREGAYHNGSTWPWDSHAAAEGMRRQGGEFDSQADEVDQHVLRAIGKSGLFPEYFRGGDIIAINTHRIVVYDEDMRKSHTLEQPPQYMQGWTAAAARSAQRRLKMAPDEYPD